MAVTQMEKVVDGKNLYTILQIEPNGNSHVVLPKGDWCTTTLAVLRVIAPEYFTERHEHLGDFSYLWPSSHEPSEFQRKFLPESQRVEEIYADCRVYSRLNISFFTEMICSDELLRRFSKEFERERKNPKGKDFLSYTDFEKPFAPDTIKTLVIRHELGGYSAFKPSPSLPEDRFLQFCRDGKGPNKDFLPNSFPGFNDVESEPAYAIALTAILTGRSVKEIIDGEFKAVNFMGDKRAVKVSVENPTAERVEKAAREWRAFLDYATEDEDNRKKITLITAQIYNILREKMIFCRAKLGLVGERRDEIVNTYVERALQNAFRTIDQQIAALPSLDRVLLQYLHNPQEA